MLKKRQMQENKVTVSKRAILQRLNRVLVKDGDVLKKSRSTKHYNELGDFYLIDLKRGQIVEKDVDIEALARKKGVLAKWEALEKAEE